MYAQKDTETLVATRLKEPWSAPFFAGSLTNEVAENVISRYDGLEKHVRLRTVLAALSLKKGPQRNLRPSLISLAREAKNDEDEWVRVIGHAVGEFSGPLDMKAVAEEFPQESRQNLLCKSLLPVEGATDRPLQISASITGEAAIEALHQRSGSADASRLDTEREEDAEEGELPPEEPYVSVETEGNELSSKERRRAEE
eukprot:gene5065-6167_t